MDDKKLLPSPLPSAIPSLPSAIPSLPDSGAAAQAAPKRKRNQAYNWEAVRAFVATGKTLAEAARAFQIPMGTINWKWSENPTWEKPSKETKIKSMLASRTENYLKSQRPDFVANIQSRMKEKAAVFCELAGNKLVDIANFASDLPLSSRKDAMADALILKTAANAAESIMGLKKDTPQSQVMINLGMGMMGNTPSALPIEAAEG